MFRVVIPVPVFVDPDVSSSAEPPTLQVRPSVRISAVLPQSGCVVGPRQKVFDLICLSPLRNGKTIVEACKLGPLKELQTHDVMT